MSCESIALTFLKHKCNTPRNVMNRQGRKANQRKEVKCTLTAELSHPCCRLVNMSSPGAREQKGSPLEEKLRR